jgi:hypothetical protein
MKLRPRCAWLLTALGACAVPAADARTHELVPDRASFAPVAQVLERKCGSLDCHGSSYRNLRVYGNESLRFATGDRPLMPACTTADEVEQDYLSAVGLEPEAMSAVVADGGAHPERLTVVRKARGAEAHKGGAPLIEGDDGDLCLTSWLASQIQTDACLRALPATDCLAQP